MSYRSLLLSALLLTANARRYNSKHRTRSLNLGVNICKNSATHRYECCRGWTKRSLDDKGCKMPQCPRGCGHNGFCQRPGYCFCKDSSKIVKGPCDSGGPKECNLNCNDGLCRFNQGKPTCVCPPGLAGKYREWLRVDCL